MFPQVSSRARATVVTAALVLSWNASQKGHAQFLEPSGTAAASGEGAPFSPPRSGVSSSTSSAVLTPGYFEVVCPGGCYGGGFHWFGRRAFAGAGYYGFFRRYWGYGTYGPNYNYGPGGTEFGLMCGNTYVATQPGHGHSKHGGAKDSTLACAAPVGAASPPAAPLAVLNPQGTMGKPAGVVENQPVPADNTAHLRLLVPEKAEVLVNGGKTSATGTVRDFVSPPLVPGKNMTYSVLVRYPDADGKPVEVQQTIRVRPNDRLNIDLAKPVNAEQPAPAQTTEK
jgi:uncharacterized protein (TIGR03000 family)